MSIYGERMKKFIYSLPTTQISIVYFIHTKSSYKKPFVVENVRQFTLHGSQFYMNCGDRGEWVFVYQPNSLREITGTHLTVGIIHSQQPPLLNTHATIYEELPNRTFEFSVNHENECWLELTNRIDTTTKCLNRRGMENGKRIGKEYENAPIWIDIIEFLRNVFIGNNTKRYLRQNPITETGGQPLNENAISMLYEYVIKPVLDICEKKHNQYIDPILLYDTNASNNAHFVLMYDISDHDIRRVFYLDADYVLSATEAFESTLKGTHPTSKALACFEAFKSGSFAKEHIRLLEPL